MERAFRQRARLRIKPKPKRPVKSAACKAGKHSYCFMQACTCKVCKH